MAHRFVRDRLCRAIRLLRTGGLVLILGLPVGALPAAPESIVLVLKLISETHARPVTGVVIAPDGQILVPARFVARGDDIVVLDGGTDILRHGRATRPVARSVELGLAVLAATGLQRPAVVLAGDASTEQTLRFVAYPPAEALAGGAPPLSETVRQVSGADDILAIDPATPLPNLDGVLLNRCGYLAGLVLAEGDPGLERDRSPRTILGADVPEAFSRLGLQPATRNCLGGPAVADPNPPQPETTGTAPGPEMLDPGTLQPAHPDLALAESGVTADPKHPENPAPLDTTASNGTTAPADETASPATPLEQQTPVQDEIEAPTAGDSSPLRILALLLVATLLGWLIGRRKPADNATAPDSTVAADEPRPAGPATPATAMPETGRRLRARFLLADGRSEEQRIELPANGSGLLLGSGQADVVIDDASVGRLHARLQSQGGALTLTDLGSSQGTWIDGIACLEGECFHLPENADIHLGRVRLRLAGDAGAEPDTES